MSNEIPARQKHSLIERLATYSTTLHEANRELASGNPTERLKSLLNTMEELGAQLERKKAKKEQKIRICHLTVKEWKRIERVCFYLAIISLIAGGISDGVNYYKQNDAKTLSPMLYAGTAAVALFVLSELGKKIYESAEKIWTKEVESLQRGLDETLSIHRTLQTMKLFLEEENGRESKVKEIAKEIQTIPDSKLPSLAKKRWIRAGIKALSPESPLRKKMEEAEELADQILDDKLATPPRKRKHKHHHKPSDDTLEEGPALLVLEDAVESAGPDTPINRRKTKSRLCKVMNKLNREINIDGLCTDKALYDLNGKVEPIHA